MRVKRCSCNKAAPPRASRSLLSLSRRSQVKGEGLVADMVRGLLNHTAESHLDSAYDNKKCMQHPNEPDNSHLIWIYVSLVIMLILQVPLLLHSHPLPGDIRLLRASSVHLLSLAVDVPEKKQDTHHLALQRGLSSSVLFTFSFSSNVTKSARKTEPAFAISFVDSGPATLARRSEWE